MWPVADLKKDMQKPALLLVGYDGNKDDKFWKIRNCYGPGWGENGSGHFRRGVEDHRGVAGINKYHAFYPIVTRCTV